MRPRSPERSGGFSRLVLPGPHDSRGQRAVDEEEPVLLRSIS
jgi:hypothetical protein